MVEALLKRERCWPIEPPAPKPQQQSSQTTVGKRTKSPSMARIPKVLGKTSSMTWRSRRNVHKGCTGKMPNGCIRDA